MADNVVDGKLLSTVGNPTRSALVGAREGGQLGAGRPDGACAATATPCWWRGCEIWRPTGPPTSPVLTRS